MSPVGVDLRRAAEELDLERTLTEVPATASVRGVFFEMIESVLRSHHLVMPSRDLLGRSIESQHRLYSFYSTRDFLAALATGGAMIRSDPREGIREIFAQGPRHFSGTWYGKAFRRFFEPNPIGALTWIERSREHLANYGRWRLERRSAEHVVVHMFEEYIWIDSGHRGGCEGLLLACGAEGEVTSELDGPFQGRLSIRWSLGAGA